MLGKAAFTLIELVMVILLLSILAAVAIPNFIDFRKDAKNASVQGSLGALRSALSIARAAIALKEGPNETPRHPTLVEMQRNGFTVSHPVLSGTSIMDPSTGMPKNPWTTSTFATAFHHSVIGNAAGCYADDNFTKYDFFGFPCLPELGYGWVYTQTEGKIWAGSQANGGKDDSGGFLFCPDLPGADGRSTEDCY